MSAAGKTGVTVVAIDGGCSNLPFVANGQIGATAGQFPGKMAVEGVDAIANFAKTGKKPANQAGQDFFNTGTQLYTDSPQPGVTSITTQRREEAVLGLTRMTMTERAGTYDPDGRMLERR